MFNGHAHYWTSTKVCSGFFLIEVSLILERGNLFDNLNVRQSLMRKLYTFTIFFKLMKCPLVLCVNLYIHTVSTGIYKSFINDTHREKVNHQSVIPNCTSAANHQSVTPNCTSAELYQYLNQNWPLRVNMLTEGSLMLEENSL